MAAGQGHRLGAAQPKAFVEVAGRPLLAYAAGGVARSGAVDLLVVVVPDGLQQSARAALTPYAGLVDVHVIAGGVLRQDSVRLGLAALPPDVDVVLVHDAARCLAPPELVAAVVAGVRGGADAVVPGLPLADTVKEVDAAEHVVGTPVRARLRAVQTPQGFRRAVLEAAHATATDEVTDDATLVERGGGSVLVVPGSAYAFKVTGPLDLLLAAAVLAAPVRGTT